MLLALFLALPCPASGQRFRFIPTIMNYEGQAIVDTNYESNKSSGGSGGLDVSSTYAAEKIRLTANGFVYHPRFMLFLASITGGLAQDDLEGRSAVGATGWETHTITEYEFRTIFLPEHPYNLELFALRQNPFVQGRLSRGSSYVITEEGGIFKYKKRPYSAGLSYITSTLEQGATTTDNTAFNATAGYFKDWTSNSLKYNHSTSDSKTATIPISYKNDEYALLNQLTFFQQRLFITTDVSYNELNQNSELENLNDKRFSVSEQVNAELPYNFNPTAYYYHYKDDSTSSGQEAIGLSELSNTSDTVGLTLRHRLYQSLITAYNINYNTSSTLTGNSDILTNSINAVYQKRIPKGELFTGGGYSISSSDQQGAPSVINEPHSARIGDDFTLNQQNIDEATITMKVRSAITGALVNMVRDVNYSVTPVGNTSVITIFSVPPDALSPDPRYTYDFLVTYLIGEINLKLDTTAYNFFVRFELFNRLVNPYYSYSHTDQRIVSLSGASPFIPTVSTTNTFGILLDKGPYSLMAQYQDTSSTTNPSKIFRTEFNYQEDIATNTNLMARAYYEKDEYPATVLSGNQQGLTTTITGGSVRVKRSFPRKNLNLYVTGTYSKTTGFADTSRYYFDSLLTWKIGKLDLTGGLNIGRTDTTSGSSKEQQTHQYYFLSVRRQIL